MRQNVFLIKLKMDKDYSKLEYNELVSINNEFQSNRKKLTAAIAVIDTELVGISEELRRRKQKSLEENR